MAKIFLPGKNSITVEGQPTLGDLKRQGLIPGEYRLVRKDPQTGALRQLQDSDPIAGDDLVHATPRHVQGARAGDQHG
jgi:hypothetical protein